MAKPSNKRSLTIARHRTSISLEDGFWTALHEIAEADERSVADIVSEIDRGRDKDDTRSNLSAAIRLYVLERMQARRKVP